MASMNEEEIAFSELTDCKQPATIKVLHEKELLTDFISSPLVSPSPTTESRYMVATQRLNESFWTERIVERQCYGHLLPILEAKLDEGLNVSVGGTPGIGKTIFGLFLLRKFVQRKQSVVYWNGIQATFFTQNEKYIKLFGLDQQTQELCGETWHWGAWKPTLEALSEFLLFDGIFVIHDPAEDCLFGGTKTGSKKLVIILSFGHALVSKWNTKRDGVPEFQSTMPVFAFKEILDNKGNLFHGKALSGKRLAELYKRFGGSVRHWGQPSESSAWEELQAKMQDVVRNGSNITKRTTEHRGSIVHVAVDFDASRNVYPVADHNTFQEEGYVLGSTDLTSLLSKSLAQCGKDQLRTFMNTIRGQRGAEAMYGTLFEYHAHEVLCRPRVTLNLKVVRYDGKNKYGYATTKIQLEGERNILEFEGQEAKGINEMEATAQTLSPDTYFLPSSPTFPTYDSAMLVPGTVVGLPSVARVGLLLQMTVSGATNILRRPKHSVKNYMRKEMHSALEQVWPDAGPAMSVTTFCVPTACFHPFLFQPEQTKSSKQLVAPGNQAEFQFVIEIPEFLNLPESDLPKDKIHGESGRVHRYKLRTRSPKRIKLDDVHQTDIEEDKIWAIETD